MKDLQEIGDSTKQIINHNAPETFNNFGKKPASSVPKTKISNVAFIGSELPLPVVPVDQKDLFDLLFPATQTNPSLYAELYGPIVEALIINELQKPQYALWTVTDQPLFQYGPEFENSFIYHTEKTNSLYYHSTGTEFFHGFPNSLNKYRHSSLKEEQNFISFLTETDVKAFDPEGNFKKYPGMSRADIKQALDERAPVIRQFLETHFSFSSEGQLCYQGKELIRSFAQSEALITEDRKKAASKATTLVIIEGPKDRSIKAKKAAEDKLITVRHLKECGYSNFAIILDEDDEPLNRQWVDEYNNHLNQYKNRHKSTVLLKADSLDTKFKELYEPTSLPLANTATEKQLCAEFKNLYETKTRQDKAGFFSSSVKTNFDVNKAFSSADVLKHALNEGGGRTRDIITKLGWIDEWANLNPEYNYLLGDAWQEVINSHMSYSRTEIALSIFTLGYYAMVRESIRPKHEMNALDYTLAALCVFHVFGFAVAQIIKAIAGYEASKPPVVVSVLPNEDEAEQLGM